MGHMNKRTTTTAANAMQGVKSADRDARNGKGVPGTLNTTRPAVFRDRKKDASRKAARGRSW